MKKLTLTAVTMFAAALTLGACGDDPAPAPAAPAPAAPTSAAAAPTSAPAAAAADPASDKALCEKVNTAGEAMKTQVIQAMAKSTEDQAPVKAALIEFAKKLDTAASDGTSPAAQSTKALAKSATEGASAADALSAMESGDFEKTFKELAKACKTVGVVLPE